MELTVNGNIYSGEITKEVISNSIDSLTGTGDSFVILAREEMYYLQACGDKSTGFQVEYQEGSLEEHYECSRSLTLEETTRIFHEYFEGKNDWKTDFPWQKMNMGFMAPVDTAGVSEMQVEDNSNSARTFTMVTLIAIVLWYFFR